MDFQEAYAKGSEALKENRLEDARNLLETALKLKPNDIYTMNKLAMVLKEQGQRDPEQPLDHEAKAEDDYHQDDEQDQKPVHAALLCPLDRLWRQSPEP